MKDEIKSLIINRKRNCIVPIDEVPAAVLLPLYYKNEELYLLFVQRSYKVSHHKGEISFPGGTLDDTDPDLLYCALRECEEEIALDPKDVEVFGPLDDFLTRKTHYMVSPFVGWIPYLYPFKINSEIERIIEIPVKALLDEKVHEKKYLTGLDGKQYLIDYFYYGKDTIWGATGLMLRQFLDIVSDIVLKK